MPTNYVPRTIHIFSRRTPILTHNTTTTITINMFTIMDIIASRDITIKDPKPRKRARLPMMI